jgi:phospholipase/carboxylesterase
MERAYLPALEVVSRSPADAAVIWLHGLGADGHDFEPIVPLLGVNAAVRFVFPHAPARPVTLNGGFVMPAWYDLREDDLRGKVTDPEGLRAAGDRLADLVRREVERGIPSRRIVVAGFSQGGAVALHAGLRFAEPVAGIVALSTWLVQGDVLETGAASANRGVAVFLAHGTLDPMVPVAAGRAARDRLHGLGFDLTWKEYPMGHEVCFPEMADIGAWLDEVLAGRAPQG